MTAVYPISPAELFADVLSRFTSRDIVPHIVVGGLSQTQQNEGGVAIMDAGAGKTELYSPLLRPRMQLRCIAPTLAEVDVITRHVGLSLDAMPARVTAHQASTDEDYLLYFVNVSGGPSSHWDTEETWEGLLFADTMISTVPVTT